jgi:hypothetical protein
VQIEDYGEYFRQTSGNKYWYLHGKLHREDGPAVIYSDGDQFWYRHGQQHREDGPAAIYTHGAKYWCLNGVDMSPEEWQEKVKICK